MSFKTIVKAVPMATLDTSTIVLFPNFTAINPNGLPEACFLIRIINNTNGIPLLSLSSFEEQQDFIQGQRAMYLYVRPANGENVCFKKGTVIGVKMPPIAGNMHVVGYYRVTNR